jgi:hypothetical protein
MLHAISTEVVYLWLLIQPMPKALLWLKEMTFLNRRKDISAKGQKYGISVCLFISSDAKCYYHMLKIENRSCFSTQVRNNLFNSYAQHSPPNEYASTKDMTNCHVFCGKMFFLHPQRNPSLYKLVINCRSE